jgi:gamma-glutamyl-gamma-aminobutyrate hydrolase PuuD
MKKLKVYVVGSTKFNFYAKWLDDAECVNKMEDADIVMFTGGEDVDPSFYEEPKGRLTRSNIHRDMEEQNQFFAAMSYDKPMIGICRGAQFLCVMAGGRLVQHQQDSLVGNHLIITRDGVELKMTSSHHQAMYPYDMKTEEYEVIAWTEGISNIHWDGDNKEISDKPFKEVEIAYFPKYMALGIQGHPEWMEKDDASYTETLKYLNELVSELLIKIKETC